MSGRRYPPSIIQRRSESNLAKVSAFCAPSDTCAICLLAPAIYLAVTIQACSAEISSAPLCPSEIRPLRHPHTHSQLTTSYLLSFKRGSTSALYCSSLHPLPPRPRTQSQPITAGQAATCRSSLLRRATTIEAGDPKWQPPAPVWATHPPCLAGGRPRIGTANLNARLPQQIGQFT